MALTCYNIHSSLLDWVLVRQQKPILKDNCNLAEDRISTQLRRAHKKHMLEAHLFTSHNYFTSLFPNYLSWHNQSCVQHHTTTFLLALSTPQARQRWSDKHLGQTLHGILMKLALVVSLCKPWCSPSTCIQPVYVYIYTTPSNLLPLNTRLCCLGYVWHSNIWFISPNRTRPSWNRDEAQAMVDTVCRPIWKWHSEWLGGLWLWKNCNI